MKKLITVLAIIFSFALLTNCEENDTTAAIKKIDFVSFSSTDETVAVQLNGTASLDVSVYSSKILNSDRVINIIVDEESTADPQSYSIPSVTIPAGTNAGMMTITFSDDNISNDGETLILSISSDDVEVPGDALNIAMLRDCPSDLAGTYAVISNASSTDGAPANNPLQNFAYQVEVTSIGGTSYSISDGFAGVYIDWYCAPYGYCFETAGNFTDVCGSLSGSWVEGFGSTVELTGQDNFDGTLTISWINGFGDTATATYTKL